MQHNLDSPAALSLLSHAGFTLLPELVKKYSNNFVEGFFEEKDPIISTSTMYHVATKEGQEAIERIKAASLDEVPDDWAPTTAPPLNVIRQLVQRHHSTRLVQHSAGTKIDMVELIENELAARKRARQEAGEEVSEDGDKKKPRRGKKPNHTRTEPKTTNIVGSDEEDVGDDADTQPPFPTWLEYNAMTPAEKRVSTRQCKKWNNEHNLEPYTIPVDPDLAEKKKNKPKKAAKPKHPKRIGKNRTDVVEKEIISLSSDPDDSSGKDAPPPKRRKPNKHKHHATDDGPSQDDTSQDDTSHMDVDGDERNPFIENDENENNDGLGQDDDEDPYEHYRPYPPIGYEYGFDQDSNMNDDDE
jgi:hypothetical protein